MEDNKKNLVNENDTNANVVLDQGEEKAITENELDGVSGGSELELHSAEKGCIW